MEQFEQQPDPVAQRAAHFVISVAAELAGMHPQTLRQYDRLGLVSPRRTSGRGRRYSNADVRDLRRIQEMRAEGISLAGIARVLELERALERAQAENAVLRSQAAALSTEVVRLRQRTGESSAVFTASAGGEVSAARPERWRAGGRSAAAGQSALVLWRPQRRF
ncbi:MAG: MerR family transcriptional regulator [Buchananella hordeovulneris]|nr:MerR family transcriptional regulator [Buchananella hordeovulneris]